MSSLVFHTGLTPTEESFSTGLTPTEHEFQPSISLDTALSHDLPVIDDTTLNLEHFQSWFSNQQPLLNAQTDYQIREARGNSVVDLVDHSLASVPSFFEELQTHGQIVGPSQGEIPSEPCSLQENVEPNDQATFFDPLAYSTGNFDTIERWDGRPIDSYVEDASGYPFSYDAAMLTSNPNVKRYGIAPFDDALGHASFADPFLAPLNVANPSLLSYDRYSFQQLPMVPSIGPQIQTTGQRKESSSSDCSSKPLPAGVDKKLPTTEQVRFLAELPEKPADKPWVRVNATTKGKTSRTGKINHYDPDQFYSKIPHPLKSAWSTKQGKGFKYNPWHELTDNALTASQLKDFIYEHPKTKTCKLTLFIQRSPADSKRRYPTSSLDKCRFKDCPMRTYGNKGSFLHGHYRVAFDELTYSYGKGEHNDPFQVAGYVHLYCLERFLDLPEICRLPHIRVEADGRQIAKEPNGTFAPALGGSECRVAVNFIEAARKGRIQDQIEWRNYPSQTEYQTAVTHSTQAAFQIHRHTLNYALQMCKNAGRGGRVMSKLKPSNVAVHRGDLDMYCLGRKNMLSDAEVSQINADIEAADSAAAIAPRGTKRRVSKDASEGGPRKQVKYF